MSSDVFGNGRLQAKIMVKEIEWLTLDSLVPCARGHVFDNERIDNF